MHFRSTQLAPVAHLDRYNRLRFSRAARHRKRAELRDRYNRPFAAPK